MIRKRFLPCLGLTILMAIYPCIAWSSSYVAYSLKEAERRLIASSQGNPEIVRLGGITSLAGMVYDDKNDDWIIVGQANNNYPVITLDDFVVVMRAVFLNNKTPLVSIDSTTDTPVNHQLNVRFEGGIANTQLGKDMLDMDILLKRISLSQLKADIWGVRSYLDLRADRMKQQEVEDRVVSRFWFKNMEPSYAERENVFVIMKLTLGVETEVLYAEKDGKPIENLKEFKDEIGDMFAKQVVMNVDDLGNAYPILKRAKPVIAIVSLADAIRNRAQSKSDIKFWLQDYKVPMVKTPTHFNVIEVEKEITGKEMKLSITGGLEVNPIRVRLKKGYPTAFKEVVLSSRPSKDSLAWNPPLQGWRIPGVEDVEANDFYESDSKNSSGFSIDASLVKTGQSTVNRLTKYSVPPLHSDVPKFSIHENLPPQNTSSNVGGVMLQGVAKVSGAERAKVDLSSGNFSLIVGGRNARLSPEAYRKFITALWSVYYSQEDPGISIDPIEPGGKKHMVRYIGKVINNDLGRVMREADYVMKKWSVGTERPDIPGFLNPDEIAARSGILYAAASRFWFVPENMKFKRSDNMLLFEDGRIRLKTEYLFDNPADRYADPANEKFAQFFTDHYQEISEKYPVYKELFDYAKMVSLAKYLKEQGVPLYWFLMANKDLVITEDSPGTVDAMVKGSDYFRGITIEGGVNLGFDVKQAGNYVYDQEAVNAINKAASKRSATHSETRLSSDDKVAQTSPEPFSFDLRDTSYTVLPQHSLTSGKDRRGIRYQTDLALRDTGIKLTEQALDKVKYEIKRREMARELYPVLQSAKKNKPTEAEIETLYNKISKKAEDKAEEVVGKLGKLKNRKYAVEKEFANALEETIGKEQTAQLKNLILKYAYYNTNLEIVRYYKPGQSEAGDFGQGWHLLIPYRVKPVDGKAVEFRNAVIPEKMAVENLFSGEREVLTFSTDRYSIAGYAPDKLRTSQLVGLFILSDASFRLADKLGNEFQFDRAGRLTDMVLSENHRFHFEYVSDITRAFERNPYKVEPVEGEKVEFRNKFVPEKMRIKDIASGESEVLVFSEINGSYVPLDREKSRFQFLTQKASGSFRLQDKAGNEIAFTPAGEFEDMLIFSNRPLVSSVSQGNHKVDFKYAAGKSGEIVIANAYLSTGEENTKPTYVVHYQYDDEGRLCNVKGSESKVAKSYHEKSSIVIAKGR